MLCLKWRGLGVSRSLVAAAALILTKLRQCYRAGQHGGHDEEATAWGHNMEATAWGHNIGPQHGDTTWRPQHVDTTWGHGTEAKT